MLCWTTAEHPTRQRGDEGWRSRCRVTVQLAQGASPDWFATLDIYHATRGGEDARAQITWSRHPRREALLSTTDATAPRMFCGVAAAWVPSGTPSAASLARHPDGLVTRLARNYCSNRRAQRMRRARRARQNPTVACATPKTCSHRSGPMRATARRRAKQYA
jgi:hypothetical protein